MRKLTAACAALLLLCLTPCLYASQSPGHTYVALRAAAACGDDLKALIDANRAAYLAGAAGPDIAYTGHYFMLGIAGASSGWLASGAQPGTESHDLRPGDIANALLMNAKTDQEKAFALGWLTHYTVDESIHTLVNQYGGYYTTDSVRHKHLEMVECEHALSQEGTYALDLYVTSAQSVPAEFVSRCFAATYAKDPNAAAYKPYSTFNAKTGVTNNYPAPFISILQSSAGNMLDCTTGMLQTHRKETPGYWARGEFAVALKGPPPNPDEYKLLMEPLKIDRFALEPGTEADPGNKLVVYYTVNDGRLFKPFCEAWKAAGQTAAARAAQRMQAYWGNPTGKLQLTAADLNGDDPGDKPWPGKPEIKEMLAQLSVRDADGKSLLDATEWPATGTWMPCLPLVPATWGQWIGYSDIVGTRTTIWGGPAGSAYFKVKLADGGKAPFTADLTLSFADKATNKGYGVEAKRTEKLGALQLSILFLIDCSGSMDGAKLEAAKAAVRSAVAATNDGQTQWGLMSFGSCGVGWRCQFVTDPKIIDQGLAKLSAGDDTPLSYARAVAIQQCVVRGGTPRGRLILLCDGQDNCTERGSKGAKDAEDSLRALLPPQSLDVTMPGAAGTR
ncbi:MAG TPA: VWA domain-containing protein [Armatimonadota bacterium]|jgi:hypothetical protein